MNTKFDSSSELKVTHNSSANRFEVTIGGHLAKVDYRMSGNRMIITHTEVPEALRGKGVAEQLVAFAVQYTRKDGLEVVAECAYANRFLNRDVTAVDGNHETSRKEGNALITLHRELNG